MTRARSLFGAYAPRLALGALALSACSLQVVRFEFSPANDCSSGCPGTSSCVASACRATSTGYSLHLFITPPKSAAYASGIAFDVPIDNGSGGPRDFHLPNVASLTLVLDATQVGGVAAPIALSATLTPTPGVLGSARYTATSTELDPAGEGSVTITVPPGTYDLELAPTDDALRTILPPVRLASQVITSGAQRRVFSLGTLRTLALNLTDETGAPLSDPADGQDVVVVERGTGQILSSTDHTCDHPALATVRLSPNLDTSNAIVQVTHRACSTEASLVRPTYAFDLEGLLVGGAEQGTLGLPTTATLKSKLGAFPVNGRVTGAASTNGITATILFHARRVDQPADWKVGNATFDARALSNGDGLFFVFGGLLPGLYDLEIIPDPTAAPSRSYGISTVAALQVDATSVATGLLLTALPRMRVTVGAADPAENLFPIGVLDARASTSGEPLAVGDSFPPVVRSQSIDVPVDAGVVHPCTATLDAGAYDFVFRLPAASGWPWIVFPGVDVATPTTATPVLDLKNLHVSAPVLFQGSITDPNGGPIAGVSIRAQAFVDGSDLPMRAVEVGETTSESDGSYTLLVPSAFDTGNGQ